MVLLGFLLNLRAPVPCEGLGGASSSLLVHTSSCLANLLLFYFTSIVPSGPKLSLHPLLFTQLILCLLP